MKTSGFVSRLRFEHRCECSIRVNWKCLLYSKAHGDKIYILGNFSIPTMPEQWELEWRLTAKETFSQATYIITALPRKESSIYMTTLLTWVRFCVAIRLTV